MKLPQKVFIKQKVELFEVLTNLECENNYQVIDENKNGLLYAYEKNNLFNRFFLKNLRPLTLHIVDNEKSPFLELKKTFAFFSPKFTIFKNKEKIGEIKTSLHFGHRDFKIYDQTGKLLFFTRNKILKPWTFKIFRNKNDYKMNSNRNDNNPNGPELALILKKWSGITKEFFTNADNFYIDFKDLDDYEKNLILCLSLALDLTIFEKNR